MKTFVIVHRVNGCIYHSYCLGYSANQVWVDSKLGNILAVNLYNQ